MVGLRRVAAKSSALKRSGVVVQWDGAEWKGRSLRRGWLGLGLTSLRRKRVAPAFFIEAKPPEDIKRFEVERGRKTRRQLEFVVDASHPLDEGEWKVPGTARGFTNFLKAPRLYRSFSTQPG